MVGGDELEAKLPGALHRPGPGQIAPKVVEVLPRSIAIRAELRGAAGHVRFGAGPAACASTPM